MVEKVKSRCKEMNIPVTTACEDCGVGKNFIANINNGSSPSVAKVQKLAEYLGLTTSELLGEAAPVQEDELAEYLDELRSRPEMRMLFHTTKGATKEQIEAIVHFIEGFEK